LRDDGEESEADDVESEEMQGDVFDEGREWRIRHESPFEMAGIAEELEFVAMKAVSPVGEHVGECDESGQDQ
jgi:hypothetical protein